MVLDIVDLLQHETRCDEFIVFSADADFTPVLRKLRRFDRRTTVLAIGFPSAAYQASADLMIDERLFVREALGFGKAGAESPPPSDVQTTGGGDVRTPSAPVAVESALASVPIAAQRAAPTPRDTSHPPSENELSEIATRIWATIEESSQPVSGGLLASRMRQEHPELQENWNGHGTFKGFFRALGLSRLIWVNGSGGRILDPSRHECSGASVDQDSDSAWYGMGATFDVVREACTLTGAPMLTPKDLQLLIRTLAQVILANGFESITTAKLVCEECLRLHGLRVRQRDVTFIRRGMQLNGHVFGQGNDDEVTLAARLVSQIMFLCEREQKVLTPEEVLHIKAWILAAPPVPKAI